MWDDAAGEVSEPGRERDQPRPREVSTDELQPRMAPHLGGCRTCNHATLLLLLLLLLLLAPLLLAHHPGALPSSGGGGGSSGARCQDGGCLAAGAPLLIV